MANLTYPLNLRIVVLVSCLLLLPGFQNIAVAASDSPALVGERVARELLTRKDYMMYRTEKFTGIHYAEAAAAYGALKFAHSTGKLELLNELKARYKIVPGTDNLVSAGHVDANVYGILPIQFYLITKDKSKLQQGLELADAQWLEPRKDGLSKQARFWIDDIWMVNSLQVQAYRATGEQKYLDRAALQTAAYLKDLQQDNGLFFHGRNAHFHWGRGNGWVAAGLAELLSELQPAHSHYRPIKQAYVKMMQALLKHQAKDGMWRQLIDKPESWKETSSTAMFGFAMAMGVKQGILSSSQFKSSYENAWSALQGYLDEKGRLGEVCIGTGQSKNIQYYLKRPRTGGDLHGQAPLLWFAQVLVSLEQAVPPVSDVQKNNK